MVRRKKLAPRGRAQGHAPAVRNVQTGIKSGISSRVEPVPIATKAVRKQVANSTTTVRKNVSKAKPKTKTKPKAKQTKTKTKPKPKQTKQSKRKSARGKSKSQETTSDDDEDDSATDSDGGVWIPNRRSWGHIHVAVLIDKDWIGRLKKPLAKWRESTSYCAPQILIGSIENGDEFLAYNNNGLDAMVIAMHGGLNCDGNYCLSYSSESKFALHVHALLFSTAKFIFVGSCNYANMPSQSSVKCVLSLSQRDKCETLCIDNRNIEHSYW